MSQMSGVSAAPPPPSQGTPVSMSQMSRLSPGPSSSLPSTPVSMSRLSPGPSSSLPSTPVSMSQMFRLSPSLSQPPRHNVSMSQGGLPGPAWQGLNVSMSQCLNVSMSQCLNVSGGSTWASTERLNVSTSQCLGSVWASAERLDVSTSQCLGSVWASGASQRLNVSVVSAGSAWASMACLNVSMSQCLSEVCLDQHGASQCLNVSVSQGGLPGPARHVSTSQCLSVSGRSAWASTARLNVSMSQCLREVCLKETRTSAAASQCLKCLPVSGSLSPLSRRRASASIQSVGEPPEHRRAPRASASIKVGFGLQCGKATQKKLDRPYLNRTTPQPAKLPLEHTARAGRMQGSRAGVLTGSGAWVRDIGRAGELGKMRVIRVQAQGFGTDLGTTNSVAAAPAREPDFGLSDWPKLIQAPTHS